MSKYLNLTKKLEKARIEYKLDEPLKKFTTYKIGGPADILVVAKDQETLSKSIKLAIKTQTPYTILGWGSNVLIADKGIRGVVIVNRANNIEVKDQQSPKSLKINEKELKPRLKELEAHKYYSFDDLDYDEKDNPIVKVNIESGAFLPATIMTLLREGITGLQWFGGIPGTLGGAVYNNIHGGTHYISEFIQKVNILDPRTLENKSLTKQECQFDYDYSRFHKSHEIILSIDMHLYKGDKEKAKAVYIEWTRRKKKQPQISAGCAWKNIDEATQKKLKLESSSWGYIIDKVLNLKGKSIGGAKISDQHAAFIENLGNAKAKDVIALMKLIQRTSKDKLGIEPQPEIFLLGQFD